MSCSNDNCNDQFILFTDGLIRMEQRAWDDIYRLGNNRRAGRSRAARSITNDAN